MNYNSVVLLVYCLGVTLAYNSTREKRQVIFGESFGSFVQPNQCVFLNKVQGTCLTLEGCPTLRGLLFDPTPSTFTLLRKAICGFTIRAPKVCCPPFSFNIQSLFAPAPAVQNQGGNQFSGNPTLQPTQPVSQPRPSGNIQALLPQTCGKSSATNTRIVDGEPAALGAWPWMALLGYTEDPSKGVDFGCGGSLITNRHILTAAHCVYDKDDLALVRLGEHDLASASDGANPIDISIAKKTIHEDYDGQGKSWQNDIAILTLARSVPFTNEISPICLPLNPELRSEEFTRMNPFVAGWGTTDFKGRASDVLQQAQVLVAKRDDCKTSYSRFKSVVIDERVLCAGGQNGGRQDACQGDSGGPLMFPRGDSYYQIGVVSFGYRCGEKDFPGIYTRVGKFVDWITNNLD
ncbi:venom protease-like [Artemia franciscana]|uniref:CLIP domain-containing serine protease n=1 Tax=Artemia franciscana TaxID=6661 RepID=A0AA88I6T7_ARTSF|nr:hypothetical protein QYM36_003589 [Artemia franciscana]